MSATIALVRRLPMFSALPPATVTQLLQQSAETEAARGATLFLQDDPAEAFFIVLDGWVKLSRLAPSGQETIVGVFTRAESFAEAAILGSGAYPVTATAVTKARLLKIPAKPFLEELCRNPALCLSIMGSMSAHLRDLVGQLERLTCGRAIERLAGFLYKLSETKFGPAEIALPHDKSLIAARLGMQPETFSRCLAGLRRQGLVQSDGDRLAIPEISRLLTPPLDRTGRAYPAGE